MLRLHSSVFALLFAMLLPFNQGCFSAMADRCESTQSPPVSVAVVEALAESDRVFLGCRPSAGECANSCTTPGFAFEIDPAVCDPDQPFTENGGGVCWCLPEGLPDPDPEPSTEEPDPPVDEGFFIGCRPSHGECLYSCPARRAISKVDPAVCDPTQPQTHDGGVACFCLE